MTLGGCYAHPTVSKFFITTAIDYTNGAPHLGHAYEKVLADVIARYRRLKGEEVYFLTGVDQHGQKVQQSAAKQGMEPQEFVDGITEKFLALWRKLDVRYDGWAATTDPAHKDRVRAILQRTLGRTRPGDRGKSRWIYKKTRAAATTACGRNNSSPKRNAARTDNSARNGVRSSSARRKTIISGWTAVPPMAARPDRRPRVRQRTAARGAGVSPGAELRNAVEKIAGDLCISRPKARLAWGIELPFDADYVTFVWFDALANYITFAPGYDPAVRASAGGSFLSWWRTAVHVIGKDILIPGARDLLADHAARAGFCRRRNPDVPRPWLVEHRRREDEQKPRQQRRSRMRSRTATARKPCVIT